MKKVDPDGQAFPTEHDGWLGMTVRTWLAGIAMQGSMAGLLTRADAAQEAVKRADALIAELNKEQP